MKLIVGLGNPGKKYAETRHNMGFMVINSLVDKLKLGNFKNKFNGEYLETIINEEKVILLKPQLYMNLSGIVVKKYIDFFDIKIDDILVISDDLDQEFGNIKLKDHGSSGGHNGLKNIEDNIKTDQYKRLKIGISNNKDIDTKDYVTSKLSKEEISNLNKILEIAENIVIDYIKIDFERLMNKYN